MFKFPLLTFESSSLFRILFVDPNEFLQNNYLSSAIVVLFPVHHAQTLLIVVSFFTSHAISPVCIAAPNRFAEFELSRLLK
jgi:hypothetical protein